MSKHPESCFYLPTWHLNNPNATEKRLIHPYTHKQRTHTPTQLKSIFSSTSKLFSVPFRWDIFWQMHQIRQVVATRIKRGIDFLSFKKTMYFRKTTKWILSDYWSASIRRFGRIENEYASLYVFADGIFDRSVCSMQSHTITQKCGKCHADNDNHAIYSVFCVVAFVFCIRLQCIDFSDRLWGERKKIKHAVYSPFYMWKIFGARDRHRLCQWRRIRRNAVRWCFFARPCSAA